MKYNYNNFMFEKVYGMSPKEASDLIKQKKGDKTELANLSAALTDKK